MELKERRAYNTSNLEDSERQTGRTKGRSEHKTSKNSRTVGNGPKDI